MISTGAMKPVWDVVTIYRIYFWMIFHIMIFLFKTSNNSFTIMEMIMNSETKFLHSMWNSMIKMKTWWLSESNEDNRNTIQRISYLTFDIIWPSSFTSSRKKRPPDLAGPCRKAPESTGSGHSIATGKLLVFFFNELIAEDSSLCTYPRQVLMKWNFYNMITVLSHTGSYKNFLLPCLKNLENR